MQNPKELSTHLFLLFGCEWGYPLSNFYNTLRYSLDAMTQKSSQTVKNIIKIYYTTMLTNNLHPIDTQLKM